MADAIGQLIELLSDDDIVAPPSQHDALYQALYDELHRIARALLSRHRHPAASPTSLISEAWLRLARSGAGVVDREHFLSLVARAMRFVIVDRIRRQSVRGEAYPTARVPDEEIAAESLDVDRLIALDRALTRLDVEDPRAAKVVELNFFAGMPMSEIAVLLGVTERTIRRDWRRARAFLLVEALPPGPAAAT